MRMESQPATEQIKPENLNSLPLRRAVFCDIMKAIIINFNKMSKKFASLFVLVGLLIWFSPVRAEKPNYVPEFPEKSGVYDVPGHPNLKVRVFVHKPNPGKPGANPVPQPGACTLDQGKNDFVFPTGWHLPSTFTYNLNPTSAPLYVGANIPILTEAAFGAWINPISGKVAISRGDDTTATKANFDGKNIITWGRASGSALAVTYTWYDRGTNAAVEVDTIMNTKFFWTANGCNLNSYDAQDILTHELGHWFGLNDHYTGDYVDNTMYGYGSKAEIKKSDLELGDINGLLAIYQ